MILILSLSFCSQVFSLDGIVKGYGLDWMDCIYLDGLELLAMHWNYLRWIAFTWMDWNFREIDSLIDCFWI